MGVASAIFESAGQRSEHVIPGAYIRSAAVGGEGAGVSANRGVILGKSRGGQPNKLFTFTTPEEAKQTLVDGELLKAVGLAFNPSPDYTPQAILAMVVNGNKQGETTLSAGGVDVIKLKTASWGVIANSITRQIVDGTKPGTKNVLFTMGEIEDKIENIGRKSIQLQYTGTSTVAQLTIDNVGLNIHLDSGDISISFEDCPTIENVIARLEMSGNFAAIQLGEESNLPAEELDHVSNLDITAEVVLTSNFYALFHALENSQWIGKGNVIKVGTANIMPDNDSDPVFFTGAGAGTYTVDDWAKTLSVLETENIQIISSPVTDHAAHTLVSNHIKIMSRVQNRKERTAMLGGTIGETVDEALEFAKGLNNKLVSYCFPAISDNNPITGKAEDLPASYFACKCLGMECAVAVNEPLTWKSGYQGNDHSPGKAITALRAVDGSGRPLYEP